ncbi:TPA: hypothetical protein ACX6QC_003751 [Photobacterium damselae]
MIDKRIHTVLFEILLMINFFCFYLLLYEGFSWVVYVVTFLNLMLFFLKVHIKVKDLKVFFVIYFSLLMMLILSHNTEYIIIITFIALLGYEPCKTIINRSLFYASIFFLIFLIIRIPEYKEYLREDGLIRYDLGFNNPNILSKYIFSISILLLIGDLKVLSIICSLIIGYIADTRTLIMVILLMPFLFFFLKNNKDEIYFKKILSLAVPILALLSILLAFSSPLYPDINKLLSYRPGNWLVYIEQYGIPIFGGGVESIDNNVLDNSYIQIIMNIGIVGMLFISVFYYWLINFLIKNKLINVLFAVLLTLIYSMFENMLKYPLFNISTVIGVAYYLQFKLYNYNYHKIKIRL